ncbi:flagellar biosynthetic protein FliO [Proteinivorax tanatarense]|uniref:Flagellar biosynthetic protein FliO n=1 Tax=Proteinivorax tanatarense TaxID=1260629 RepID=A0AAU7VQ51_9FIRM
MSYWAYLGQIMLVIIILIALIVGAVVLIKFINKKMSVTSNNTMEIIDGISIAPNKGLYLVRVVSKYYLLGVGESVRLIKEIDDPSEVDLIKEISHSTQGASFGDGFSETLMQQINKMKSNSKGE